LYQELAPIISNQEIMPGTFLLKVRSAQIAASAKPGQFVMVTSDDSTARLLRRPISLYSVYGDELHFLFAVVGDGTRWLSQRQKGDTLDILGPAGKGFTIDPKAHNLLLVGGGMGLAPLIYLAANAIKNGLSIKLAVGSKTSALLLPAQSIPQGVEYLKATEDGSQGEKGFVTSFMQRYSDWADQIFICGPLPMYQAIQKHSTALLGGKPAQVSLEVRMGCGMGICYSCTVKTTQGLKQVCKDGPVFDFNAIDWNYLN
jgi:dihydroorotate dehydrogenase electron transfer subunit